jgi:hypothetical protein
MPNKVTVTTGGDVYTDPFQGPAHHTAQITIDPSILKSTDFVDSDGLLKPGTIFEEDGTLAGGAGTYVFGVVRYPIEVAAGDTDALLDAAPNVDIVVFIRGVVDKDTIEDNIGRALTQGEVDAFNYLGSHVQLLDYAVNT